MKVFHTVKELRSALDGCDPTGIGFVPTMGALHAGHRSLVERARTENATVVVSVFVNPTQFNDKNDLVRYPRTPEADARLLEEAGADYVLMPSVEEIYPEPDARQFDFGAVDKVMEGATRPGHFNGVAQIVSRLFDMVRPTRAYFGEKDFQQIAVIRRMVELEGFDLEIVECPICRHDDGLAMSSRNVRLTPAQRDIAPAIHRTLKSSVEKAENLTLAETRKYVVDELNSMPHMKVEYYEIVDPLTMQPIDSWEAPHNRPAVGCVTCYCGEVRLIDNIKYNK